MCVKTVLTALRKVWRPERKKIPTVKIFRIPLFWYIISYIYFSAYFWPWFCMLVFSLQNFILNSFPQCCIMINCRFQWLYAVSLIWTVVFIFFNLTIPLNFLNWGLKTSFCLYELYLLLFTVLEVSTKKLKIYVTLLKIIDLLLVNINNIFLWKMTYFPKQITKKNDIV